MGFLELLSIACAAMGGIYVLISFTHKLWPYRTVKIVRSDIRKLSHGKKSRVLIAIEYAGGSFVGKRKWEVVRSAERADVLHARVLDLYKFNEEIKLYCDPITSLIKIPESPFDLDNKIASAGILVLSIACIFFTRALGY